MPVCSYCRWKLNWSSQDVVCILDGLMNGCPQHVCAMQLARQMALLPIDSRLKPAYLARAGGLAELPSDAEDNPSLSHLLPSAKRNLPRREGFV